MKTVLIIDRNGDDRATAEALLAPRYVVRSCSSFAEATEMAREHRPNVLVIDVESLLAVGLPDPSGAAESIEPRAGVVYAAAAAQGTSRPSEAFASDPIAKPYRAEALYSAVRLAAARSAADCATGKPRESRLGRSAGASGNAAERELIGDCAALRNVAERIELYAASDAPVLILGESGTGKELAAAAIHRASRRGGRTFLPVDCAAISETLAESTLFGTVKGAYTDAVEKRGAFECARGGTVFLDEIGELSLSIQAKLLRALETGKGSRVGSVEPIPYDMRILSATNAPLFSDRKRFRPELLHRIDTLVLEMPALRDHKGDIPALTESFMAEFGPGKRMTDKALSKLMAWEWPGNVRELRNVIRRATVLSGTRKEISPAHIEVDGASKGWQASLF